jgi:WD40 repeat protein
MPESPYRGIQPYTEQERDLFFGREREQVLLAANLRTTRLSVLYGPGGVGKSSLLQAGVAPLVRESDKSPVVVFRDWQGADFRTELHRAVLRSVDDANVEVPELAGTGQLPFDELLFRICQRSRSTVFLILDQFEEYFLYHQADPSAEGFEAELARAINSGDIDANFVFVVPEESLSKLDRLAPRIPDVLGNLYRLEHLTRDAAERAIREPLREYNRRLPSDGAPVRIEAELVEMLLDEIRGSVSLELSGQGRGLSPGQAAAAADKYETPFLQLVLTRLWEEEMTAGSAVLRVATLSRLGGAKHIVQTRLDEIMAQLDPVAAETAAAVFNFLVTPSGTKIAQDAESLASWAGVDRDNVANVLSELSLPGRRLLRRVETAGAPHRWEVFHDVLGPAILDWRMRYVREQQRVAFSRELAQSALALLPAHPELCLLLAIEAAQAAPSSQAKSALREALVESHFRVKLVGHEGPVLSVDYSPDGALVATAGADGTVRMWASTDGRLLRTLQTADRLTGARFSPRGDLLVTSATGGLVRIWDARSGALLRTLELPAAVNAAAVSPDGTLLVTASADGLARIWELGSGLHEVRTLSGHDGAVVDAQFDHQGLRVVTGSADETARIWDVSSGEQLVVLRGAHRSDVWSAAFDPAGERVVTASFDRTVAIWDVATGRCLNLFDGHTEWVKTAAFSPDGRRIVTASYDGTAQVWDLRTARVAMALYGHAGRVVGAAFSPDGHFVATASGDRTARIWYVRSEHSRVELVGHDGGLNGVWFSPDGSRIVTASGDETAWVWDWPADPPRPLVKLVGHTDDVWSAAYSPDGRRVVTASLDRTARVWDASSGQTRTELAGHTSWVSYAEFSPDGMRVVTSSLDHTARLWDADSGELIRVLAGHGDQVYSATFSPDGRWVVTASLDETVRLWDVATGAVITELRGHTDWVGHAAFSPDGRWLATSSWDRTTRIWSTDSWETVAVLRGHAGRVRTAVFSPDGQRLVTASGDCTALVWSVPTWLSSHHLKGHLAPINYATFSPDSTHVATASHDGTARVYDLRDRETVADLIAIAKSRVSRELTPAERELYLHE